MKYLLASVLVVMLGSLVGCGDSSAPSAPATQAPAAQANESAAQTNEPATQTDTAQVLGEAAAGATQAAAAADLGPGGIDLAAGEAIYNRTCLSCHAAGLAGAPKLGATEDWAPRVAKGIDALVAVSIKGVPPAMPAKGLCLDCSEADMLNAVAFMLSKLE